MGAYAEIVRASFPGGESEPELPRDTGWVLLTMTELPADVAAARFPSASRLLVVGGAEPRRARGQVAFGQVEAGPPPRLEADTAAAIERGGFRGAVLLDGLEGTSGRVVLELARAGVERFAYRRGTEWVVRSARSIAFAKPLLRLEKRLALSGPVRWYRRRLARARAHDALRERNAQAFAGETEWRAHLERVGVVPVPPPSADEPLRVVLYIGQLNSGGAERQLVNLAVALRAAGHRPRVLTTYALSRENAHYLDELRDADVPVGTAGTRARPGGERGLRALGIDPEVVCALPEVIRDPVLDLAGELLADRPHVLHAWLDYPNVIAAAAGALVGTPHLVLSARNVNPTHFPAFYQPWMDRWYGFLVALPQVHLLANSGPGAEDYARWMGVAPSRFEVIRNGVDLGRHREPTDDEVAAVRAELGLSDEQPLVAGVFRLAQEKQPRLFVDVVERVLARVPELAVAVVGVGELRDELAADLAARGLDRRVHLLGQRKDVAAILQAADVKLLTSAVEGTPNVILEAQWHGCPPVATAVGGTPDALDDGDTGLLYAPDDREGLADGVVTLLRDPARRAAMAVAGRELVADRFSVERMVAETLDYYGRLLDGRAARRPARDIEVLAR